VPQRRSAEAARTAIQEAALATFVAHGYERTSLEEIAERLGITRQAVLYHFGSKEDLLRSVVLPGFERIRETLDSVEVGDPPSRAERRRGLAALVDVLCQNRGAVAVLAQFSTESGIAHLAPSMVQLNERMSRILGGSAAETDPLVRVRVVATMSALRGIMSARLNVPLDTPEERRALVNGCLAMLGS
jgi:AcrR family transcriptional regulator